MSIKTTMLDNGIKIAVYSFKGLETVGMVAGIRYGSIDEDPSINGSAHFLEHMLFKGTEKRTWKMINEELKVIGANWNASTGREATMYYMGVYKKYANRGFNLLSDMIKNSTIPTAEMELERGPIINENLMRLDKPYSLISDYMPKVIYTNNPAKMPVGGNNEKTIKNITRDHLFDIYKMNYVPENMIITFAGAITPKEGLNLAEKYFGDFSGGKSKLNRHPAREKQQHRTLTISKPGIKQAMIGIGFKCGEFPKNNIKEYLSMVLLNQYLDYRIYEEIREKRGLSYDPSSTYISNSTYGFIAAEAGTEPKNVEKVKHIILKEFQKLEEGEIEKKDLKRNIKDIKISSIVSRERSLSFAEELINYEFIGNDSTLAEKLPNLITNVTLDDVRKFAAKYIKMDRYGMVLLKPKQKSK